MVDDMERGEDEEMKMVKIPKRVISEEARRRKSYQPYLYLPVLKRMVKHDIEKSIRIVLECGGKVTWKRPRRARKPSKKG